MASNERSSHYQFTAQELVTGDFWFAKEEMEAGKFNVPIGVFREEISTSDLEAERVRIGRAPIMVNIDGVRAFLSLESLDPFTGETVGRPKILIPDTTSGELVDEPNLTDRFYQKVKEMAEEEVGLEKDLFQSLIT